MYLFIVITIENLYTNLTRYISMHAYVDTYVNLNTEITVYVLFCELLFFI